MSFTYNGTPGANVLEAVRYEMQDINPAAPLLEDAEVEYAITVEAPNAPPSTNEILSAAARCMEVLSRRFAAIADRSSGTLKIASSKRATIYAERAVDLRERSQEYHAPYAGGISRSEKRAQAQNPDREGSMFRLRQFQNRRYGRRGGW